jgi:hypothetical protein
MPLLRRKTLILAKIEATYGTNSSPSGSDAILVRNLDITPLEADVVGRDLIRPYYGNSDQLLANPRVRVTCEVELAGSGTAGTAPRYGPLLKSCGISETIVASTSVTYAPRSDFPTAGTSCTIVYNIDGVQHAVTGARGTFTMNCELGQIPTLQFEMTGVYNNPTDTAQPAVTYAAQATPLIFRDGNTSAFSFFSYSGCLMSVNMQLANSVVYRELVGCTKQVLITDRKPAGTVSIEAPTIATKDYFSIALGSATGSLSFLHGTTAGNRVTFTSPQSDVTQPTYGESDGIAMLSIPYVALPTTAGNDEFSLAFT